MKFIHSISKRTNAKEHKSTWTQAGQEARMPVGGAGGLDWEVYVTDDAQLVTSVLSTRVSCLTGEKFALCYLCKFAKERKLPDKLELDI